MILDDFLECEKILMEMGKLEINKKIIVVGGCGVGRTTIYENFDTIPFIAKVPSIFKEAFHSELTQAEQNAIILPIGSTKKQKRNALCLCGNGKKNKKCCGVTKN